MYDANGNFVLGQAVYAAMGQAFFTFSLGIGALAIFGSYIGKEHRLASEAVTHRRAGHLRGTDERASSSSPPASPSGSPRTPAPI